MKKLATLVFSILTAVSSPAKAITGNDLHGYCKQGAESLCLGLISGAVNGFVLAERYHGKNIKPIICPPEGVTNIQYVDIVKKYLNEHPSERHEGAFGLIAVAVSQAYPCK